MGKQVEGLLMMKGVSMKVDVYRDGDGYTLHFLFDVG
jgi:hypothetical protein